MKKLIILFAVLLIAGCSYTTQIYQDPQGRFSFEYPDFLELEVINQDDVRLTGEHDFFIGIYVIEDQSELIPGDPTLVKTISYFEDPTIGINSEVVVVDNLHIVFSVDVDYYQENIEYFYQILDSLNLR